MPLLQVVMVLIVVGILLWLINRFIPMQGTIKSILNAVVVIAVVLWLLNSLDFLVRCLISVSVPNLLIGSPLSVGFNLDGAVL